MTRPGSMPPTAASGSRPGAMIPPSDTRPVLWKVRAYLDNRPRVEIYDTTWTDKEALMRAYAQVRADASLPPHEWERYHWTVLRADEAHHYEQEAGR